jgi:lysophospholipase L1-like esterase
MDRALVAVYEEMIRRSDTASLAEPLTASVAGFNVGDAYAVSREVLRRREASGWRRIGRRRAEEDGQSGGGDGALRAQARALGSPWRPRPAAGGIMAESRWLTTWAAAMRAPGMVMVQRPFEEGFKDHTLRQIVRLTVGGSALRIRVSNLYGIEPLRIESAWAGLAGEDGRVVGGSSKPVTFGGRRSVVIPAAADVLGDPVDLRTEASQTIAVSMYLNEPSGPPSFTGAGAAAWVAVGDRTTDEGSVGFEAAVMATGAGVGYFLTGVEVLAEASTRGALACLGDSITAQGWPFHLAGRVLAAFTDRPFPILNLGIAGNRILGFGGMSAPGPNPVAFGQNALARFDRDVVARLGVRALIFFEGINDIGFDAEAGQLTADDLIFGHKQVIERAHAAGLRAFGATLLPFRGARTPAGAIYWTEGGEAKRHALNDWICNSGAYDGVFDFASAVTDGADPPALRPEYDSGDHLHPSPAGQLALAEAVDLRLLDF